MPLARYVFLVGGALLALLFVSDALLPKVPLPRSAEADLSMIRIRSDRKWPERMVFDTNAPTAATTSVAAVEHQQVPAPAQATVADVQAKLRVRDTFAQLPLDSRLAEPEKPRKRKIARRHAAPAPVIVAQQPQFGLFGNGSW